MEHQDMPCGLCHSEQIIEYPASTYSFFMISCDSVLCGAVIESRGVQALIHRCNGYFLAPLDRVMYGWRSIE